MRTEDLENRSEIGEKKKVRGRLGDPSSLCKQRSTGGARGRLGERKIGSGD